MMDLSTRWLGLPLKSPLVASCGPLTGNVDTLRRLEDAGLSAVVLPSIFEEQIEHEEAELFRAQRIGAETFGEAAGGYFPDMHQMKRRSDEQLELIAAAKAALSIPVIASLNGHTQGGWVLHARKVEEAGADALELNVYTVPADVTRPGIEVERDVVALVRQVRAQTQLPLAVKLSPFYSSPGHFALQLAENGASGLVLFNRFLQPDIDLDHLAVEPRLTLSSAEEMRLPLRWIALLKGRVSVDLAATSGVHQASDVVKLLLAGADVTMMTSALLRHGPGHAAKVSSDLSAWLTEREYESVEQMKGSLSQVNSPDPSAFERAQYMAALTQHVWRSGW